MSASAIFRTATAYAARPVNDPAWFQSKVCYYCFNYVIELVAVYTYAVSRFDCRFYVPDGSSAPGHYSCAEFGDSTAVVAAAIADFEKHNSKLYEPGKRASVCRIRRLRAGGGRRRWTGGV